MTLEKVIEEYNMKKVMICSDIHAPFHDAKAVSILQQYQKAYKPDVFVINGDLCDMYSASKFSKSPERKLNLSSELMACNQVLDDLIKYVPKAKKVLIEGNHEYRLQQFVWDNPSLAGLDSLDIKNLLDLDKRDIKIVRAEGDYWKGTDAYKVGDVVILHGDNRLDGASYSKFSGYSAKNTMFNMSENIVMGHTHRGAIVYHKSPSKTYFGAEGGCLCQMTGNADWQQGFLTMELDDKNKAQNIRFHRIEKGRMYEDGKLYRG